MSAVFERPFVIRSALCYRTVVCLSVLSVLSVTLVYCSQRLVQSVVAKWLDGSRCHLVGR